MITAEQLKRDIKSKFGTYSRFCRKADIDRYTYIDRGLNMPVPDQKILLKLSKLVERLDNSNCAPDEICEWQRLLLKDKIIKRYGSVAQFLKAKPSYRKNSVSEIINGRRHRMTQKVKELFDLFKISS